MKAQGAPPLALVECQTRQVQANSVLYSLRQFLDLLAASSLSLERLVTWAACVDHQSPYLEPDFGWKVRLPLPKHVWNIKVVSKLKQRAPPPFNNKKANNPMKNGQEFKQSLYKIIYTDCT